MAATGPQQQQQMQAPLTASALTRAIATATDTVGVGRALEYLLATGNVLTRTGLGIQQVSCSVSLSLSNLNVLSLRSYEY